MKREIKIDSKKISYSLKKSKRAKRMRIAVYCDGSVVVTSPQNVLEETIKKFLHLKSDWVFKKLEFFSKIEIHPDIAVSSKDHFLQHRDKALKLVRDRVDYFARRCSFKPQEVRVKLLKTKWGSCSVKRNLNFNYKILFLKEELCDYIIVHELCHLKQMNHSNVFWGHVEKILPNYRHIREELKKAGL